MTRWAMRDLAREPLLHFVVLGAALFALDRWVAGQGDEAEPERAIVIDADVRAELADRWLHAHGERPSEAELERLVERWVDEEVLYREALARGLDRDDPQVRARLASSMAYLLDAQAVIEEPSEEELRAHFEAHAERWAEEARLDFTHVFVPREDPRAEARAAELLAAIEAGASPNGLGETFPGGRRYRGRRLEQLGESFGPEFVQGLEAQPEGVWALRRSRYGVHLVRVDARSAARAADFARAREDVRHDLREARAEEARARELARLRARWDVVVRP